MNTLSWCWYRFELRSETKDNIDSVCGAAYLESWLDSASINISGHLGRHLVIQTAYRALIDDLAKLDSSTGSRNHWIKKTVRARSAAYFSVCFALVVSSYIRHHAYSIPFQSPCNILMRSRETNDHRYYALVVNGKCILTMIFRFQSWPCYFHSIQRKAICGYLEPKLKATKMLHGQEYRKPINPYIKQHGANVVGERSYTPVSFLVSLARYLVVRD